MKKLIGLALSFAMVAALSFGPVGCGKKDTKPGAEKDVTKEKATTPTTPPGEPGDPMKEKDE